MVLQLKVQYPVFKLKHLHLLAVNSDVHFNGGLPPTGSGSGVSFQITDTSVDIVTITIGVPVLQKIKKNGDTAGYFF